MKELKWVEVGTGFVAELELGRVVISPTQLPNIDRLYSVRIELKSGEVVAQDSFDFETCQIWAEVNLTALDQITGKFRGCGNVLETLEMCQRLISLETDAIHWLRIEYIKKWMAEYSGQVYEIVEIPVPEHKQYELNWIENGKIFYADTPHGRAEIEEIRRKGFVAGGITHKARIVHHTGAVLDCYSYVDFLEAEDELKRRLAELDDPHIYEVYLPNMHFTLDICERILPIETDPIHFARLENLGGHIHEVLD